MTQGNLLNLYQQLAELPGEDQRQHRIAALQAGWRAFSIFRALGHGPYQQQIVRLLQALQRAYGAEFAQLWQQAIAEPMPAWLQEEPQDAMQSLLNRFLAISTGAELAAFWQQMPAEAEPGFFQLVEQWIAAAAEQHNAELAEALRQRLAGIQQLQAAQSPLMQQFQQALSQYLALRQQAAQDANNPAAWQAAVHAGEALLGQEFAELEQVNWTELRAELANDYTSLCIAHEEQHALEASLAATERAIELAPENAMWRRNRTGTLIDLGRLDEAAAELERARALEPEAARLAELEQQLHPEG